MKWIHDVTTFFSEVCLSVCTECIVAKGCILEQKLLLTAYMKRDRGLSTGVGQSVQNCRDERKGMSWAADEM